MVTESITIEAVMTTLNEKINIERAVESLFNQSLPPKRLIIVDAGSTDGTLRKIEDLKKKYPIKLIIRKGCNRSEGRNEAIKRTISPYIFSLNADVKLHKNCLKNLFLVLKKDPKIGAVGGLQVFPRLQNDIAKAVWFLPRMSEISEVNIPSVLEKNVEVKNIPCECCLWRRRALFDVGLFNEKLNWGEDPELHYRMRKKGWKLIATKKAKFEHFYRDTIKGFMKQQLFYGIGGFELVIFSPEAAKEILGWKIYTAFFLPILLPLILLTKITFWIILSLGLCVLISSELLLLKKVLIKVKKANFLLLVILLQTIKHVLNLLGFYVGFLLWLKKKI